MRITTKVYIILSFAGISLEEVKRFDEAILMFNKALQIDPNNSNVYDHKGIK